MKKLDSEDIKTIIRELLDDELIGGGISRTEKYIMERYRLTEKQSGAIQSKLYRIVLSMKKL